VKKIFTNPIRIFAIFFAIAFSLSLNVNRAEAATRTWTGTTSTAWSVGSNWSGGTAPVTGDDLVFPNGASNLSNTNDFIENTIFNSITFSGSGYTLSGNPIILGAGLAGITDSVASGGNTIALDIRLDVTRDIVVTNTAETLTISGRIAGVGGINKEGTGELVLSGANTFGGVLKINVGVVNAQNDRALGTNGSTTNGTEVVGGAALELQGTINIGYEALALRGYGVSNGGALRNVSDNNTFGGLITMIAGGAEIDSDSGTLTITGGMSGAFPLVIDGAGDITYTTAPIGIGSGTVTKNGSGTLKYNFPNTYTGTTFINAGILLYGIDNALLSSSVTVNAGTLDIASYSDMLGGTVTLGTTDLSSGTITGTTGVLSAVSWTLNAGTISAIIAGDGSSLTKNTLGTVTLTRPNLYTGNTSVAAGILKIQDSTALGLIDGVTTVTSGATLQIDGSGLSVPEYITFSGTGHLYTGAIRNMTGDNTITGLLTISGTANMIESDTGTTLTIDSKGLSATTLGLVVGGAGNVTFTETAPIYGTTATLTKNDTGVLTMEGFSNFTGATNLSRGEIVLNSAGAIPNSTITIGSGGTLTLDNTSTTILNRISDTAALTMNGGNFNFIGNTSGTAYETAGALTPASGHNVVTVTPGAGGSTTMTFASLSRTAGATVLFRGTSLGSPPAANVSTVLFTTAPTLTGAAGAANSSTISVIKGAFGDNSLSGTGTDMVTYNVGNTNGLRLLNSTGFSGEYSSTLTTNTNVKLIADTAASTVSINSLILNGYDITNASATITMASASLAGNILINSANNIAGASTTIGITTNELDILATANSTISAVIGTAVAGSLTLSGSGNITLSAANAFTGLTAVNNATLTYGASNVLSSGGVTVVGGTLDIAGNSDTVGAVTLQNGTITGTSGILSGTSYSLREGTVSAILGGGAATVTRIATSAAADSVVTLTRDNTYTGVTTITSGILKLGGTGGGTNTPLGTTGTGTTIANGGALDLNGYTLGTAEAITSLAGTGFGASGGSNMGAIMNSSASPATYSGALTLTAAARINADAGTMTISSDISGNFALTFGGFSDITYSGVRSGTSTLTKDGIGTLTLSNGNSSYTGATTISVGTVKLGAVSVGGTNSPLGTTAGITTVATGARLDLNGYSLGIAEPLTLNGVGYGLGDFASGALMNSSGSTVTYSGLITLGSATTIKADSGTINLTAAGTITGANTGLVLGGTGNGTLSSIIGTTGGTLTKIGAGTWTLSGASTFTGATSINVGTLKMGATGSTTNTPLGVIAGATSVLSGAVLDLNGFTLTAAEPLTTNGRGISDGGAIVNSGGALTYSGAITQATDTRIANSGSGLVTFTGGASGAFALYLSGTSNIAFSTGVIGIGAGTVTKQGSGTLTLTGTETYTGATRVDAGTFAYGSNVTVLAATNLTVAGGIFDMAASTDTIGSVTLVGGTIQNGTLTAAASYTLESGTISAVLAGAIPVAKNTNNTVTLTGANTISSGTAINAGTLTLSGSGSAVSTTITVNLGGTLTLDNSATAVASRLGDALALTLNGGNFNFIGNASGASSETTGALAPSSGHSVVTITPGAGGSTTMTFASFSRTAGATILFRGTSFGSTPAANVSTLMFTTSTGLLTGAAGAANSTTASVIKGAFGDNSLSGTGTDMVTYSLGNTNGLRLLNGAGFSGEYSTSLTTNTNVKLSADTTASTVSINSLILNGFAITNPGSAATITISQASLAGNILINSATNIAGANTTLGIGALELDILATNTSTISAVIGTATTGSVVLSGSGNVTLSAANLYTSTTFINNATLTAGASNVISSGGVTIVGGMYNLNANSDTVGTITINAGSIATGAGTLTGNGTFTTIANNNVASIITGNLGLGANATFTIGDGLMDNDAVISAVISGGFTFGKAGAGVLELAGSNTYTGLTTISAGTIRLGAAGGATNTPLGTTAAGTTVASGFSLDLNGFTLGTAEALTISGTGVGGKGALMNTSSTAVTYSGLITLGAAATITANYGTMTLSNTGSMTGTGFALTLRGLGNGVLKTQVNTSTAGSLVKNDAGTWEIWGDSNYTGVTTVSFGLLRLGAAGGATNTPLGTTAGATTVASSAMLDLNGFTLGTAEPITINGSGIANTGAFINSSNNSISYTGAVTLGAASRIANHGTGMTTLTGNISGNFALTVVAVGNFTQSTNSVWSGSGTLTKEGSGTLILAGQNTMTGAMTVSTGTLQLGANGGATNTPFGTIAGGVTVSAGAVLDLSTYSVGGASTWEPLTLAGSGLLNGGALISNSSTGSTFATLSQTSSRIVNNGAGVLTITGAVSGASSFWVGGSGPTTISGNMGTAGIVLTKYGAGTLTLTAANTGASGGVRINEGTLAYGIADALSTPTVSVAGGTLDLKGFNETNISTVTLIDGSIVSTGGAATLTSTQQFILEKGTISAVLGSALAGGMAKNTAGRVILSGDNSFTSTSIALNAGYLNLQHSNALGASGTSLTTTISGGATLELQNNITLPSTKLITANGTGVNNTGAIRNVADSNTISANVTLGTTNVRINSDSGTLTFPTMSGNTFNAIFGGAGSTSVTGIISTTSGNLTKDGAGTLTLSGANTYSRPTMILGGTIVANATAALGDGTSTNTLIFNGGTLQASGTITSLSTRAVTLTGNGTIDTNGNSVSIAGTVGSAGGLTKAGLGTLTLTGVTTIGGNLTISDGTFVAPTSLTINGDFSNSGTFTHSNGTVTFVPTNSTLTANILGSSNTTFYNLTNTTAGSTLQFKAGNTYTFANTLTLTGIEGNPISINSDTPTSQWLMTLSGSSSISYLKVKDSGCSGGNTVGASTNIYDYGNNGVCWSFITITKSGGGGNIESSATPDGDQGGGGGGGSGGGGATTAIATAVVSSNIVQSVTINSGGSGYTSVPTVLFCGGGGSGALGTAVLTGDAVSSVTVDNGGSNYTTVPSVVFNSNCPTTGGGGGGGGSGGDIGFLYKIKRMLVFSEPFGLSIFRKYL
jgi:autotransporter-associated beta strand protein